MPRWPVALFASSLVVLGIVGCTSPARRIEAQPAVFGSATPEQQALIRQGAIAIGFKPEFVKLALGEPDRITERTDAGGTETVWHYTETGSVYIPGSSYYDPLHGPLYPAPFGPAPLWGPAPPMPVPTVETDRLRVYFRAGLVSAFERVLK